MVNFKEDIGDLIRGSGVVLLGTVVGRLFGLAGQIIIVRNLSPETFGHLALAFTIVSSIGMIAIFGTQDGVTRFLSANESVHEKLHYLRSGVGLVVASSVTAAVLVYLFRYQIGSLMGDEELPQLLSIFIIYLLVFPLSRVLISILRSESRPTAMILARDFTGPVISLSLLFSFIWMGMVVQGAIVYWLAIPLFTLVFSSYFSFKLLPIRKILEQPPDLSVTKELWKFSWPLAVSSSFMIMMSNLDVMMIGLLMESSTPVGLYRSIQPLREVTIFVLGSVTFLYLPLCTKYYENEDYDSLLALYKNTSKWISSLTLPIVIVVGLFPGSVIFHLFGSDYLPAAPALTVLIFGYFLRVVAGPTGATIKAIDRSKVELVSASVGTVANVVVNVLLIPRYGIVGAAFGTAIGFLVYNLLELTVIYKDTRSHPFSTNLIKPSVLTVGFAIGLKLYFAEGRLSIPALMILGAAFGLIQLVAIILTRSFDEYDEEIIGKLKSSFEFS